jgi:hypothetical protein
MRFFTDDPYLFSLIPLSPEATRIVTWNPEYCRRVNGVESLSFKAENKSRISGRLVSFGRLAGNNDVVLPDDNRYAQFVLFTFSMNMKWLTQLRFQCSFYLVESGELLLEDATTGHHTYLTWFDDDGRQEKYFLQGDPRRRVIPPVAGKKISIYFGRYAYFQFIWHGSLDPSDLDSRKEALGLIAKATIIPSKGMGLAVLRDPNLDPTAYESKTANTPSVPVEYDGQPLRQIHVYSKIGAGAFGVVSKAVDLATGSIWAVKECKNPGHGAMGETWKVAFKREVEKLAKLSHVSFPFRGEDW